MGEDNGCDVMTEECKKEFSDLSTATAENRKILLHIKKKLFESNGERAMVELIRDNKMAIERHCNDEHNIKEQRSDPVRTRKIKMFKDIVSAENYSATDIIKISVAVSICILLVVVILKLFSLQSSIGV